MAFASLKVMSTDVVPTPASFWASCITERYTQTEFLAKHCELFELNSVECFPLEGKIGKTFPSTIVDYGMEFPETSTCAFDAECKQTFCDLELEIIQMNFHWDAGRSNLEVDLWLQKGKTTWGRGMKNSQLS